MLEERGKRVYVTSASCRNDRKIPFQGCPSKWGRDGWLEQGQERGLWLEDVIRQLMVAVTVFISQNHPTTVIQVQTTKICIIIGANSLLLLWKEQYIERMLFFWKLASSWVGELWGKPHLLLFLADTVEILDSSTLSSSLCWPRRPCLYSTHWSIAIDLTLKLLSLLSEHILTQRWISVSNPFGSRRY